MDLDRSSLRVPTRLIAVVLASVGAWVPSLAADIQGEQWRMSEIQLRSTKTYSNPYLDVSVTAQYTGPGGQPVLERPAFWDGGDTWRIRFAPPIAGVWTYRTVCSDTHNAGLHRETGTIDAAPYAGALDVYRHGFPKKAPNGRTLVHDDGTPFFYLGDTHWFMEFEDWATQFRTIVDRRVAQGFTVYQSHPYFAGTLTNAGSTMVYPWNFAELERRFRYVADAGLVHAFGLATDKDGAFLTNNDAQPYGPRRFARYMAARYGAYPVLFFTTQEVDADGDPNLGRWKNAFDGWNEVNGTDTLATCHLWCSTAWECAPWGDDPGHDLQFLQAGHGTIQPQAHYEWYWDYAPLQPYVEAEANYEQIHLGGLPNDPLHVRIAAYKAIQDGALGFGYGANGIWNNCATKTSCSCCTQWGDDSWSEALEFRGAEQMTIMRGLYASLEWWRLQPRFRDPGWSSFADSESSVLSTIANEAYVAYFYGASSAGTLFQLDDAATYTARWFDPRTGTHGVIGRGIVPSGGRFTVPEKPSPQDHLLLLTSDAAIPPPAPSDNLALDAVASASETDWVNNYDPERAKDGHLSVDFDSWANSGNVPAWLQLEFDAPKTFNHVELYTTASYPIRDFRIQYWDGAAWRDAVMVRGNTAEHRTYEFRPVTARRLRLYGESGPSHQPNFVRVTELQVFRTDPCSSSGLPPGEAAFDLRFSGPQTLAWSAASDASVYDLYRGAIATPWSNEVACRQRGIADPSFEAAEAPESGGFYYVLSGENACGEGTLGRTSSGSERPNGQPCP